MCAPGFPGLLILVSFLVLCVTADLQNSRIPSAITAAGTAAGIILRIEEDHIPGVLHAAAGFLLPVIILWPLFRYRMLGAGDIKMAAMAGSFLGYRLIPDLLLFTFLSGGLLSLTVMLRHRILLSRFRCLIRYCLDTIHSGKPGIYPYRDRKALIRFSLPIFTGTLLTIIRRSL